MIKKETLELFKAYFVYVALLAVSWSLKVKDNQIQELNKEWREDKSATIQTILENQREQHEQYEKLLNVTNEFLKSTSNDEKADNNSDTNDIKHISRK